MRIARTSAAIQLTCESGPCPWDALAWRGGDAQHATFGDGPDRVDMIRADASTLLVTRAGDTQRFVLVP